MTAEVDLMIPDADSEGAAQMIASQWLQEFSAALEAGGDADSLAGVFAADCYWRDCLSFTWDLCTLGGVTSAADAIRPDLGGIAPREFRLISPAPRAVTSTYGTPTVVAFFQFHTTDGAARGCVRLVPDPEGGGGWKAWVLLTQLEELASAPETVGARRPRRSHGRGDPHRSLPDVVVVGAGQCGLSVAARLERLGLDTVILERHQRVGDNWRGRYPFLALHDPVWANHLPYVPFPSTWPVYPSGPRVADWLEAYVSILDLDVRTGVQLSDCSYDAGAGRWDVEVRREDERSTLRPRHLVLAIGKESEPREIDIPGREIFTGRTMHSCEYAGGEGLGARHAVVVGASTSAHDIALDLTGHCESVTMLQRSATYVMSVAAHEWMIRDAYAEDGPPTEIGDMLEASIPSGLLTTWFIEPTRHMAEMDRELLSGLRAAGYAADLGPNGAGLYARRMAGFNGVYIEVGAGASIANGDIVVVQGREVDRLETDRVVLNDGSELPADLVVFATGFQTMEDRVASVLGPEMADAIANMERVGDHGNRHNLWRGTAHDRLWIAAGNFRQARYYSRFMALKIRHSIASGIHGCG